MVYAPGTGETDPKKQNMSLQALAAAQATDEANIAANTAAIAAIPLDSIAKAWVFFSGATTPVILASYNVTSVTRASAGVFTVNFTTPFSSINYVIQATAQATTGTGFIAEINGAASTASACGINTLNASGTPTDPNIGVHVVCYGRQ